MNDCDALLQAVTKQARALGLPVSEKTAPHVVINSRTVTRFGCCRFADGSYTIEVAANVAMGGEGPCRETLAHELLHTCPGCRNHGARWREYARRMNQAYGYNIRRTTTNEAMGVVSQRPYKYLLRCEVCGTELGRYRASPLTRHPERYRCRCGGRLKLIFPVEEKK